MYYFKAKCFLINFFIKNTIDIFTATGDDTREYSIVYCTDNNYTIPTLVSMLSAIKNLKNGYRINFYIIVNKKFPEYILEIFNRFGNEYSSFCNVIVKKIDDYPEWIMKYYDVLTKKWPAETLFRLLLPGLFKELDKCLYLDSDTLVVGDFSTLYDMDFDDNYIIGIKDLNFESHNNALGVQSYINAGVILMNLRKIRNDFRNDFNKGILEILDKYRNNCTSLDDFGSRVLYYPDQNILNIIFDNKIKHVSKKYNYSGSLEPDQVIIHFYISDKPWRNKSVNGAKEWWNYYNELYKKGYFWNRKCCRCCRCCRIKLR